MINLKLPNGWRLQTFQIDFDFMIVSKLEVANLRNGFDYHIYYELCWDVPFVGYYVKLKWGNPMVGPWRCDQVSNGWQPLFWTGCAIWCNNENIECVRVPPFWNYQYQLKEGCTGYEPNSPINA